jgi:hypothetical protein
LCGRAGSILPQGAERITLGGSFETGTRRCIRHAGSCGTFWHRGFEDAPGRRVGRLEIVANRLADETSPYLLQHKDNPVDWYPWGEEALKKAR